MNEKWFETPNDAEDFAAGCPNVTIYATAGIDRTIYVVELPGCQERPASCPDTIPAFFTPVESFDWADPNEIADSI